jgi:hypothetical protein
MPFQLLDFRVVTVLSMLAVGGLSACVSNDDDSEPGGPPSGAPSSGAPDGGASKGPIDVCAAVPKSVADAALGAPVEAQPSPLPATCQYVFSEDAMRFTLLQLRIHDGEHVGGTRQDAANYVATVRSGAGLPPDGKRLLEPVDINDYDGGFWHAYAFSPDGTLESGSTIELWLRTGDDLILAQQLQRGEAPPESVAAGLRAMAKELAAKL